MLFPKSSLQFLPLTILCLFLGMILIIITSFIASQTHDEPSHSYQEIDFVAQSAMDQLNTQVEVYMQTLYGTRAYLAASDNVTRQDWSNYYQIVGVGRRLEAMGGLAYIERVPHENKDRFLNQVQSDKSFNSRGYESIELITNNEKAEYYIVKLLEPSNTESARGSIGFDITSESVRKAALDKARDTNTAIMTRSIISSTQSGPMYTLYVPVYDASLPQVTPEERRVAIKGAVSLAFQVEKLFATSFAELSNQGIQVHVFEGPQLDSDRLIYKHVLPMPPSKQTRSIIKTIDIGGQTWTIQFIGTGKDSLVFLPSVWARLALFLLANTATGLCVWLLMRRRVRQITH